MLKFEADLTKNQIDDVIKSNIFEIMHHQIERIFYEFSAKQNFFEEDELLIDGTNTILKCTLEAK